MKFIHLQYTSNVYNIKLKNFLNKSTKAVMFKDTIIIFIILLNLNDAIVF